jgi:hypothetical protein
MQILTRVGITTIQKEMLMVMEMMMKMMPRPPRSKH